MEGEESPNMKKAKLEERNFYTGVTLRCFAIFLLGFGFAFASLNFNGDSCKDDACKKQNEILKIVALIPAALGLGALSLFNSFIKDYFEEREAQLEVEMSEKRHELEREMIKEKHELEREVPSEYRYSAEMDFLYVYYQKTGDIPDGAYRDFCQQIRGCCNSRGGIKEQVDKYVKQRCHETTEEVLMGLDRGFSKNEKGQIPFFALAKQACNHALKLENEQDVREWAKPFYVDITLYLNAWLRTSVRHGFAIPIRPFVLHLKALDEEAKLDGETIDNRCLGEEAIGHYHEEKSYIQAIEYIRKDAFSSEEMKGFFPTLASQNMVKDYLGKLVHLLEDEKLEPSFQDNLQDFSIDLF